MLSQYELWLEVMSKNKEVENFESLKKDLNTLQILKRRMDHFKDLMVLTSDAGAKDASKEWKKRYWEANRQYEDFLKEFYDTSK